MPRLTFIFSLIGCVLCTYPNPKIDKKLENILNSQATANICISFASQNDQIYQSTETQQFKNRAQKIDFLMATLQDQAYKSQQNVVNFLKAQSMNYKSFWISNQIFISNATKQLVDLISKFSEVAKVEEENVVKLDALTASIYDNPQQSESWNLQKIQVTDAWTISKGQGVVVATIDSGARFTHEALRGNYRDDYGWYDPFARTVVPIDLDGHGTHTMGILAGTKGIGVAPESKWIACKGCDLASCTQKDLTACGQWILCPTKTNGLEPNCSMAPHVVSNSWSSNVGNESWYEPVINAWVLTGIVPVFAIGNSGPNCGTTTSPGDMLGVIGVGSTDSNDAISTFSSVGPTVDGRIKPDFSAPGSNIRSASNESNAEYRTLSGTSMAAPHVAGTIALILSKTNGLNFQEVRTILETTVDTNLTSQRATCGGVADSSFPNNHFGYGRLNAFEALKEAPTLGTTLGSTSSTGTASTVRTTSGLGTTTNLETTTASGTTNIQFARSIILAVCIFLIVSPNYRTV